MFNIFDFNADAVDFLKKSLETKFAEYKLSELTNKLSQDNINLFEAHPIHIIGSYVVNDNGNVAEKLPAIGIIESNDNSYQEFIGGGYTESSLTKTNFDTEMGNKDGKARWREGKLISQTNIDSINAYYAANANAPLHVIEEKEGRTLNVKISIWSHHPVITRVLKLIVQSVLMSLKKDVVGTKFRNKFLLNKYSGVGNLVNYEFGAILYGYDWELTMSSLVKNIEVDTGITEISEILTISEKDGVNTYNPHFKTNGNNDVY